MRRRAIPSRHTSLLPPLATYSIAGLVHYVFCYSLLILQEQSRADTGPVLFSSFWVDRCCEFCAVVI